MNKFSAKCALAAICAFAMAIVLAIPAYAAITGTISGTVGDSTGAVLPGVTVLAVNQDTGVNQSVVTDTRGFYSFSALPVGSYTITATQPGFETFKQTGIKVDADSSLRVDVQFKVGTVSITETVESNAVQIETQSTQLGEVIETQKITSVPLNGRSYTDLLALQPGVSPYSATTEGNASGVSGGLNPGNVSINGGREASNGFMVNGGDVNDGVNNGAAIIPNLDSISEFRIVTNNFDAEYGNFSGGQVNVVTKNGTNSFHGSGFEFFRNTDLDAANYFDQNKRGAFNQNIYGGTAGGPIKKNKVFFFGDFQGTNQTVGSTANFPVYSNADMTGNLSDQASVLAASTVSSAGLANYLSNELGYPVTAGEAYYTTGCTSSVDCVLPNATIPLAKMDPAAKAMLKYIPATNTTVNGQPYFETSANSLTLKDYKEAGRVDVNARFGSLFAYYFMDNDTVNNPYGGVTNVSSAAINAAPGFPAITKSRAQLANVGLTTTFKSNAVNTFRFTYMRSANHTNNPTDAPVALSSLGFTTPWGNGGISNINTAIEGVPNVNFNNFSFGNPVETQGHYDNTFQWLDNYMKVIGTHTFQFGGNYHYDQIMERNNYAVNGSFGFNGAETGLDIADYMLGDVEDANFIQASLQLLDTRSNYLAAYAEDSWRALPNLTVNYGVRWEMMQPWYDATNKLETAIPGVQSVVFPTAPKGYLVPGDPGVPRTLAPTRSHNFAPRLGFAYQPSGDGSLGKILGGNQMSIRGGFGLFFTNIQDESGFIEVGDAPFGDFYASSFPVILSKPFYDPVTQSNLATPFPFAFPSTSVSASNPDKTFNWASVEPISGSALLRTTDVVPYVESYYLSIQRAIGANTVVSATYVGSQGRHLMTFEEANPSNQALCLSLSQTSEVAANSPATCGPFGEQNTIIAKNGTVYNSTRGPFGGALGSNGFMTSEGTSNYNSVQFNLRHTSKIWEGLLGYTYGRSMDDGSGLTDATNVINPKLSYGLSNFDFTQYLVGSYTVHLPFDMLTHHTGWANQITKGWSVSGITKFSTGLPVGISETDDRSLLGTGGVDEPNYTPGKLAGDHNPRDGKAYFNTGLFSQEDLGTFGSSHRRFFHGPGLNNTDMALLRDFHIHESNTVQFRAEAFNIFNHAQFGNPGGNFSNSSGFGFVNSAGAPRILQIAVKYEF